MTLDDIIKLPSYSMARVASEADGLIRARAVPDDERVAGGRTDAGWRGTIGSSKPQKANFLTAKFRHFAYRRAA